MQDPAFEHYLLQDLDSRELLPLTPAGRGNRASKHRVRHGQGYTVFECLHRNMVLETTFFADRDERLKLVQVSVRNEGIGPRRMRALAMVEWQLGAARGERRTVHTWKAEDLPAVFGQQRESSAGFGGSTGFVMLAGLQGATQWTCERSEFFAGRGRIEVPDTLGQRAGSGLDACAAVAGEFTLAAGQSARFSFMLGHAEAWFYRGWPACRSTWPTVLTRRSG